MLIRFLTGIASQTWTHNPGDIVDVDDIDQVDRWVRAGHAELVEERTEANVRETATSRKADKRKNR